MQQARAEVAAEFDAIHTVDRACRVGSLDAVIDPHTLRPTLIRVLEDDRPGDTATRDPSAALPPQS